MYEKEPYNPNVNLNSPLRELFGDSSRITRKLKGNGIETVGQLVGKSAEELMSLNNVGRKTLTDAEDYLYSVDLEIGMSEMDKYKWSVEHGFKYDMDMSKINKGSSSPTEDYKRFTLIKDIMLRMMSPMPITGMTMDEYECYLARVEVTSVRLADRVLEDSKPKK